MLFDLKGRRRRVVQGTYLLLAILMGGGLVLFGIGGDVSGGLFDAFSDRSSSGSNIIEDRIDENEKKLETDPKNAAALKELASDWYNLANDEADPTTRQFSDEGKERLAESDAAWQRYLDLDPKKPDAALASVMINVYAPPALNKPAEAAEAAEILTAADPRNAQAFLQLATYAAAAGQERKADLAGQRAVQLAPKDQRSTVKQLVKQATQAPPPASTTTTPSG